MNDMTAVIVPKSDQINADDLIAGPITITIRDVQISAGQEQPVSMYFDGSKKAYRPCKSMSRVFVAAWGADAKAYVGRSVRLYRDPDVLWGGLAVGGIRISHMSHIDKRLVMSLTATKKQRKPYVVDPLVVDQAEPEQTTPPAEQPKKSRADWVSEIDALPDMPAVAVWLNDNSAMKTSKHEAWRELYAYAEAHGQKLIAAQVGDMPSDIEAPFGDDGELFLGDR